MKEKASGAKESVQEAGSKLGNKAHGNNIKYLFVLFVIFFFSADAKEGLKETGSEAMESAQRTGSKIGDKAHGIFLNKPI